MATELFGWERYKVGIFNPEGDQNLLTGKLANSSALRINMFEKTIHDESSRQGMVRTLTLAKLLRGRVLDELVHRSSGNNILGRELLELVFWVVWIDKVGHTSAVAHQIGNSYALLALLCKGRPVLADGIVVLYQVAIHQDGHDENLEILAAGPDGLDCVEGVLVGRIVQGESSSNGGVDTHEIYKRFAISSPRVMHS